MERKKGNFILVLVVIVAVIIAFFAGKFVGDSLFKDKKENNASNEVKNDTPKEIDNEKNEITKEESLDVNSNLVTNLYNSVVPGNDNCFGAEGYYWTYNESNSSVRLFDDFYVSSANENEKLSLVSLNLDYSKLKNYNCNDYSELKQSYSIVNSLGEKVNRETSICNNYPNGVEGFSRDYVEEVYKKLFGKNASLNTYYNLLFTGDSNYVYFKSLDAYVKESEGCGGGSPSGYSSVITKAIKYQDRIEIYEDVKFTDLNEEDGLNNTTVKNDSYVLTFNQEDENYVFVSRVQEK